jgi:exonuclease SbcD
MSIGQEHMLLTSAVAKPCFDYVALGHIHRHQVLNDKPPVVYPGSLDRLDFGDEDDEKGFYVVEIEHSAKVRGTEFEFRSLGGRRFLTIQVTIEPGDTDPTAGVLAVLEKSYEEIAGNIVRLEVSLQQESESRLDEERIRKAAAGASYFSMIKNVKRQSRPRLGDTSAESLSPCDALRMFIDLNREEYSDEQVAKLLEAGTEIIKRSREI